MWGWGEVDNSAFVYNAGDSFGERALLRDEPQAVDIVVISNVLVCFCISQRNFKLIILDRKRKEKFVKDCTVFKTTSYKQVAVLVGVFSWVRLRRPLSRRPRGRAALVA